MLNDIVIDYGCGPYGSMEADYGFRLWVQTMDVNYGCGVGADYGCKLWM